MWQQILDCGRQLQDSVFASAEKSCQRTIHRCLVLSANLKGFAGHFHLRAFGHPLSANG